MPDPRLPVDAAPWNEWARRRLDRIFAEGRQPTAASNEAEADRDRYRERAQEEMAKAWVRRNNLRRQDESGDARWLLQSARPSDDEGRAAVAGALRNIRPR